MNITPITSTIDRNLIFDLGFHEGLDSRFYLDKGFNVVGLDANPLAGTAARERFTQETLDGRLQFVERALASKGISHVTFFTRDDASSYWSSLYRSMAERDGKSSRPIDVETTTLSDLFDRHGVPYYIKCDIEGADNFFADQLLADRRRPPFISVEVGPSDLHEILKQAGYDRFQIVDQSRLKSIKPPYPPREGRYVQAKFDNRTSGLFAHDLDPRKWVTFEEVSSQIAVWRKLPRLHKAVASILRQWSKLTKRGWLNHKSWLDIHATTAAELTNKIPRL